MCCFGNRSTGLTLFIGFIFGLSAEAGEPCYTDYYKLEHCEYGCCGTDISDRHCCNKPNNPGTIIGWSVGGGVLLIIVIIIICLCKCNSSHNNKNTNYIKQHDSVVPSISEHAESCIDKSDRNFNNRFPGITYVYPCGNRVCLNSHVIEVPGSSLEEEEESNRRASRASQAVVLSRDRTKTSIDTRADPDLVLTPVVIID